MPDLDVNGALEAVKEMMESWSGLDGLGIGRVYDYIPDLNGEVPYREHMEFGNQVTTIWVINESGVPVHLDDDMYGTSFRGDVSIEIQGLRPYAIGDRTAARKWRDDWWYVLKRLNERQYLKLGTDTPGSRRREFSVTDPKIRPITLVDHFSVVMAGTFANAIVPASPAAS